MLDFDCPLHALAVEPATTSTSRLLAAVGGTNCLKLLSVGDGSLSELAALKSPGAAAESSLELSASRGRAHDRLEFSANLASAEGSMDLDQNFDVVEDVET